MGTFLIPLLVAFSAGPHLGKRSGEVGDVLVKTRCAEPTNIYLENQFGEALREPAMLALLENKGETEVKLRCKGKVVDFRGREKEVRPAVRDLPLKAGQEKKIRFTTAKNTGAFVFSLEVSLRGEGGRPVTKVFSHAFAVSPAPRKIPSSDAFFRIEGARVWRPYTGELCHRIGVRGARVLLEPGINQELFGGWVTAARSRGLSLSPVFPADRFLAGVSRRYATKGAGFRSPYPAELRWKSCSLRLAPGALNTGVLRTAERRISGRYMVEGRVAQLEWLLRETEGKQAENRKPAYPKFRSIGVMLGENGDSSGYPDYYFCRLLDRAGEIARKYGKAVSLCRFNPRLKPGAEPSACAHSLVRKYVIAALSGFRFVSALGSGGVLAHSGKQSFALGHVHAVLSDFLGGRVPVVDVWPHQTLLYGCIFAEPGLRPAGVLRSDVLSARDQAVNSGIQQSGKKVAVVFSCAPRSGKQGLLSIPRSGDMAAYNITGNPTGRRREGKLTVPFGEEPVFLTARSLSVSEFAGKLRRSRIKGLKVFHMAVQPFTGRAFQLPSLRLLMDNSDTQELEVLIEHEGKAWETAERGAQRFLLDPGEVRLVTIAMKKSARNPEGVYPCRLKVHTRFGSETRKVSVPTALLSPLSASIDGRTGEWQGLPAVPLSRLPGNLSSGAGKKAGKKTSLKEEEPGDSTQRVSKMWAGYNGEWMFFCVKVYGPAPEVSENADTSAEDLREALTNNTNGLQIALGFGARSKDCPHESGDPRYWKGVIRATDYLYLVRPVSQTGCQLVCLHRPGMVWGESLLRGSSPVKGGKATIRIEDGYTVYEGAIPLDGIPEFNGKVKEVRLGLVVDNGQRCLQLSKACGIPSYLASGGSFLPAFRTGLLPNLVTWGVCGE